MRFEISTTSGHDDLPPCKGAADEPGETRTAYASIYVGWDWFTEHGFNHRVEVQEDGTKVFAREEVDHHWFIEVPDLEALLKLVDEVDSELIIGSGEQPSIEIYNDYRE